MSATVATPPEDMAEQVAQLAVLAARGELLPAHFSYRPHLVTAENVAQVAAASLDLLAEIPSRLVDVNRQAEQGRMKQLETGAAINRHMGALLDRNSRARSWRNTFRPTTAMTAFISSVGRKAMGCSTPSTRPPGLPA